jgi:hypothetical protein
MGMNDVRLVSLYEAAQGKQDLKPVHMGFIEDVERDSSISKAICRLALVH